MSRLLTLALLATAATSQIYIATKVETFHWTNPFAKSSPPPGFEATCTSTRTFPATQHMVQDVKEPPPFGLEPWSDALPFFFGGRPFPGSWEGIDHKVGAREVVKMRWADVPRKVQDWIREKQGVDKESDERYLFGVYEGATEGEKVKEVRMLSEGGDEDGLVVFFAAGALYEILPLWVADGSDCEAELLDLANYADKPEDGKVVAWPVERTEPDFEAGDPGIEFTVTAQVLRETEEGREARLKREEEKRVEEEERRKEEEEARLREEEEASSEDGEAASGEGEEAQPEGREAGSEGGDAGSGEKETKSGEAKPAEGEADETTVEPPAESATSDEAEKDEL